MSDVVDIARARRKRQRETRGPRFRAWVAAVSYEFTLGRPDGFLGWLVGVAMMFVPPIVMKAVDGIARWWREILAVVFTAVGLAWTGSVLGGIARLFGAAEWALIPLELLPTAGVVLILVLYARERGCILAAAGDDDDEPDGAA